MTLFPIPSGVTVTDHGLLDVPDLKLVTSNRIPEVMTSQQTIPAKVLLEGPTSSMTRTKQALSMPAMANPMTDLAAVKV